MDSLSLPTLAKLHATLLQIAPEDAASIIEMVESALGLSQDIDGLHELLDVLPPIFAAPPWTGAALPTDAIPHIDALITLNTLQQTHPGLVARTATRAQLRHTITERPLIATWIEPGQFFDEEQQQAANILKAALFIWRTRNRGNLPTAIHDLCRGIRRLCKKHVPTRWPQSTNPSDWLEILILQSNSPSHPLHDCSVGLSLVLSGLKSGALFRRSVTPPRPASTTGQHAPATRKPSQPRVLKSLPRSTTVYIPPKLPDDEPELDVWLQEAPEEAQELASIDQLARLRDARYRSARENNFLPWDWQTLNPAELRVLIPLMLNESRPEFAAAVTLCLITIACGVDLNELLTARFVEKWDSGSGLQINPCSGEWARSFPQFPGRFAPSSIQASALAKHDERLILPLPQALHARLRNEAIGTVKVSEHYDLKNSDDAENRMRDWLTDIRQTRPFLRATPARLRRLVFDEGIRKHGDELIASLTINSEKFAPTVGFYYYSTPGEKLAGHYQQHLARLGLPTVEHTSSDARFGSHLYLNPAVHARQLRKRYAEDIVNAPLPMRADYAELVRRHRHVACHTAWLLQCATGHRAAGQFSFSLPTLDPADGWAILRDKVVDEAHGARLVRLSPLARQQIAAYTLHLRGLAQRMVHHDRGLAEQIGRMAELPGLNGELRNWLFLLPAEISQTTTTLGSADVQSWLELQPALPGNLARHWFISALRARGLPGELVAGAAGHIQAGQQPWSASMPTPPAAMTALWDHVVDAWLDELGFSVQSGIPLINKKATPTPLGRQRQDAAPPVRASAAEQRLHLKTIKALLKQKYSGHSLSELLESEALQQDIRSTIQQHPELGEQQKKRLVNALTRFVRSRHGRPAGGFVLDCPAEVAPFHYDHLLRVQRGNWLREHLPRCFPDQPQELSLPELLAWGHLCLSIESGLLDTAPALLAIAQGGLRNFQGQLWLEWEDRQRLVRCWPGPLSSLVCLTIHSRLGRSGQADSAASTSTEKSWSQATVLSTLNHILEDQFGLRRHWPADPLLSRAQDIQRVMTGWQQQHWPGLLAAYARGEFKPWAMPQENLLRLLTRQRQGKPDSLADNTEPPALAMALPASQTPDYRATRQALKTLRAAILNYRQGASAGMHSAREVSKSIQQLAQSWEKQPVGAVMQLLAHYARHSLSRRNNGKRLATSTIINYVFGAGEPLAGLCWGDNLLDFDSEQFEEIYTQALSYNEKPDGKKWRGKYLRYFHEFLVEHYDASEVDFAQLDPAFEGIAAHVHAQILRYQEYLDARLLLRNDQHATSEERQLQELALILVFRLGLRIGECLRLRRCDLVQQDELLIAYVRESRLGSPKSRAGFRQTPCWTFSRDECELLSERLAVLEERFPGDSRTPLFSTIDSANELIPHARLRQRLLQALKLATGNPECRIHHARHTLASVITLLACAPDASLAAELGQWFPGGITQAQKIWLNVTHPTRRLMHALSCHLGHANLDTTLSSYTHSLDLCVAEQVRRQPLRTPITRKLANWVGSNGAAIKVRRFRAANEASFMNELVHAAIKKAGLASVQLSGNQQELPALPARSVDQRLTLVMRHRIIATLKANAAIETVAATHGMTAADVTAIREQVSALEQKTGYNGFGKARTDAYLDNDFYQELSRSIWTYLESSRDAAAETLAIWRKNYDPRIPGLALANVEEQNSWSAFLKDVGAIEVWFAVRESQAERLDEKTALLRHRRYRSQYRERRGMTFAPVLFGQFHDSGGNEPSRRALSQRELHHIMALASVHTF